MSEIAEEAFDAPQEDRYAVEEIKQARRGTVYFCVHCQKRVPAGEEIRHDRVRLCADRECVRVVVLEGRYDEPTWKSVGALYGPDRYTEFRKRKAQGCFDEACGCWKRRA